MVGSTPTRFRQSPVDSIALAALGTSAHSELDYASSSTGDLHFVKRRSDTTTQRRFLTKLDFARSDSTPAPKSGVISFGSPSFSISVLKRKDFRKILRLTWAQECYRIGQNLAWSEIGVAWSCHSSS